MRFNAASLRIMLPIYRNIPLVWEIVEIPMAAIKIPSELTVILTYQEASQSTLINFHNHLYSGRIKLLLMEAELVKIQFSEAGKRELHHQRYHHPHPRVQKKMEVLWLKSQGFSHQDISLAAGVNGKTLVT